MNLPLSWCYGWFLHPAVRMAAGSGCALRQAFPALEEIGPNAGAVLGATGGCPVRRKARPNASSNSPRTIRPTPCERPLCAGRKGGTAESTICTRSEEHTSELQSRLHLVCRLLLEK